MAVYSVNQYRRAEAIAKVLREHGATASEAERQLTDSGWSMAARLSGAPVEDYCPSPGTRALVLELLAQEERIAAVPLPTNPIEGLPV